MQDVFAKALTHWSEFRSEASPLTWLIRIATHHCLNVQRAERAPWHQRFARETRARGEGHGGPQLLEDRDTVRKLLAELDLETQQAAIHYFVDEMTLDEVATALGRSVPTVRKRLESVSALAGRSMKDRPTEGRHEHGRTHRRARAAAAPRRRGARARTGPVDRRARGACADCRARLRALDDEQRRFEQEISFDRFAAGVERAARGPRAARRAAPRCAAGWRSRRWRGGGVALVVTFHGRTPQIGAGYPDATAAGQRHQGRRGHHRARRRGDGAAHARRSTRPRPLAPGERVRIGYQPGGHRYLLSLSIDERGEVTPLYPEPGRSVTVPAGVGAAPRATCPTASS